VIHNLGGSLRQAFLTVLQTSRVKNKPTQAEAWEPVGFEGGFGPKGLGNLAQALAWVALH
jgi:hypothetical protein